MVKKFSPDRLREARGERSFEDLASACRRTHQTIRNWESGQSEPDASDLAAIAALTGKPLDFFFTNAREGIPR